MNLLSNARRPVWLALVMCGAMAVAAIDATGVQRGGKASGAPVSSTSYQRLSGDLTVRQSRVGPDGRPAGMSAPAVVLHLDRERHGQRWRTTLVVRSTQPASINTLTGPQELQNPFVVSRFEYDDDGTAPRMYNRAGALIQLPGRAAREGLGVPAALLDPHWTSDAIRSRPGMAPGTTVDNGPAAGLFLDRDDHVRRRAMLERHFGRSAGTHRGLERFINRVGDDVQEVLADPVTAVPVEVNTVKRGQLVSRATFDYQTIVNGAILRRRARSERVLNDPSERFVSDIELSNLTLGEAAGR
jgi:hypothetical protein